MIKAVKNNVLVRSKLNPALARFLVLPKLCFYATINLSNTGLNGVLDMTNFKGFTKNNSGYMVKYKGKYIGNYATPELAKQAYEQARNIKPLYTYDEYFTIEDHQ